MNTATDVNPNPRDVLAGHIADKPVVEQEKILQAYDGLEPKAQRAAVGIMHLIKTGAFLGNNPDETN